MADDFITVVWTAGDIITEAKLDNMTANDEGFWDGTAIGDSAIITRHIADASVTSRKLKPTIDVVQGSSGTIVNANQDYDVVSKTITPEVTSTVIVRFKGFVQQNTNSTVTGNVWKDSVKSATNQMLSVSNVGAQMNMGVGRTWKYTGVVGGVEVTFKITFRCNLGNVSAAEGSLEIITYAE